MRSVLTTAFALAMLAIAATPAPAAESVTAYVALDRIFSEPILDEFEEATGIEVNAVYDVEATKTVGLVNRIISEKDLTQCDVFWNNEILQTLRLKEQGLLQPYDVPSSGGLPEQFTHEDWNGFAARARVIIYNKELIAEADVPRSILEWGKDPAHNGKFAVADAHFGTTSTHLAVLVAKFGEEPVRAMIAQWKAAEVAVLSGNATVRNEVAAGRYAFGLTDTDDAFGALDEAKPVGIVYPTEGLLIPNTIAFIQDAPHSRAAQRLIDYILRPETERALAHSGSGQIPLRPQVQRPERVPAVDAVNSMEVDWAEVVKNIPASTKLADALAK